ncbi:hypothetical protein [Exiguobacterium flavidum]|uniref:hypothetical protein n=1 Tax=Exiguobacterium flavidum TaxID=2184695 RepID=UPI000DF792CB|nr:hypothetical protein [Exiguobacterium flavidum]
MNFTIDVHCSPIYTHRLKQNGSFGQLAAPYGEPSRDDFIFASYAAATEWLEQNESYTLGGKAYLTCPATVSFEDPVLIIRPHRNSKPSQPVFSKSELKTLLIQRDERINSALVVDFDGFLHLLPLERSLLEGYPVRLETFIAGDSLPDVDTIYRLLLQGWFDHLTTGEIVYAHEVQDIDEEALTNAIRDVVSNI